MKKKILLVLITLLLLTACSNKKLTDAEQFKKDYESLNNKYVSVEISSNNPIIYKTEDEIIDKINKNDLFVLLIGESDDNTTRKSISNLLTSAKDNNITIIYYLDTKKEDTDKLEEKLESLGEDDDILDKPSLIAFQNGKILEHTTNTTSKKAFDCVFKCIAENSTTCQKNSC